MTAGFSSNYGKADVALSCPTCAGPCRPSLIGHAPLCVRGGLGHLLRLPRPPLNPAGQAMVAAIKRYQDKTLPTLVELDAGAWRLERGSIFLAAGTTSRELSDCLAEFLAYDPDGGSTPGPVAASMLDYLIERQTKRSAYRSAWAGFRAMWVRRRASGRDVPLWQLLEG